jgi:hypothetical protein
MTFLKLLIKSATLIIPLIILLACHPAPNTDESYNSLQDGQAKIVLNLDNEPFYPAESIFTGDIQVSYESFRINLTDQFEGNVVIAFNGQNWYKQHPVKKQIFVDNQMAASVMIGKIKDRVNRIGEGYLMADGEIKIESISETKLILRIKGQVGRYQAMREPSTWNKVDGLIIYKKPKFMSKDISPTELYF